LFLTRSAEGRRMSLNEQSAIAELRRFRDWSQRDLEKLKARGDADLLEITRASFEKAEKIYERIVLSATDTGALQ